MNNNYVFVGFNSGGSIGVYDKNSLRLLDWNHLSLSFPWGISFNKNLNKLIVAEASQNRLREYSVSDRRLTLINSSNSSYSSSNGYFRSPTDAGYDSNGNIYATDLYNSRIQKFNSSMIYQSKFGSYTTNAGFRYPYGIHVDNSDNIFVTDFYNFAIRKYNTSLTETATYGGAAGTRLDAAKKVIKKIVSNTDLTSGANFGLMEWGSGYSSRTRIRVKISDTGANQIYRDVDSIYASGGTDLRYAMQMARNYFTSGQVPNWNLSCSLNFLIVISDGYWSYHNDVLSIADQLNNAYNVKTFAVGFAVGGANSNYQTLAQRGGTTNPLYADNETDLLAKLTEAIKQVISGRLTFTTPAVMSDVQKGDFVYQSTFEYEIQQWKGSIKNTNLIAMDHSVLCNGMLLPS